MAAVLARLQVHDVDAAAATTATLFVRCKQKAQESPLSSSKSSSARLPALQLDVVEGNALWRGEVAEEHKPVVLDCTASEYLRALESVFSPRAAHGAGSGDAASARAFVYKWSRVSGVLTLMEESASGFAMKYTSLRLTPVSGDDKDSDAQAAWQLILQEIVNASTHTTRETTRQRARIGALEALLEEKDAVLETALQAKQQLEDQLFEGFCAVLNAKKDEIQRLQHELAVAQVQAQNSDRGGAHSLSSSNGNSSAKSKKPRQPRTAKASGAKLKRKANGDDDDDEEQDSTVKDEEDEADSRDESDSHDEDDDDDDSSAPKRPLRSRRVKREAVDAYSQLAPAIRSSSQVYTADDVLSDLDAIMQQEVEANDAIQAQADNASPSGRSSRAKRLRAAAAMAPRTAAADKKKRKSDSPSRDDSGDSVKSQEPKPIATKPAARPPPPPPAPAIDSEEEDILDMLA